MQDVGKTIKILLAVTLLVVSSGVVLADYGDWTENWNEYMLIQMGQTGHGDVDEPTGEVENKDRPGRWGVWSLKGDPETTEDDNIPIINTALPDPPEEGDGIGPAWRYGFTTIRIDGSDSIFGDGSKGGWIDYPYSSATEIGNYVGLTGCYINSRWRITQGNIFVRFRLAIIRDQVRFEVYLRNDDTAAHNVGLRHCADSTTDGVSWLNGDTISYPFVPGRGIVMSETIFRGTDIPDYFELYDDPQTPKVALRNTLRLEDATPPDQVAIGWWHNLQAQDWDYSPVPDRIVPDYGWAIWWDPVLLNPGESRTIITYFGMAAASNSWTSSAGGQGAIVRQDPFCVAVQSLRALPIYYDPDQTADRMLQSNPFKIKAYVYNLYRDTTLTNVNVHLTLPPGLELLDTTPAMQEILSIAPETESMPIVWDVRANGTVTGELKYWVSVSGTPGLQKTVTRSIMVPATGATQFKRGWQMVAVPFKFSDSRIEEALKLAQDTFTAYYWDPQILDYRPATTVALGKSFWLKSNMDRSLAAVARDARPLSGTESYRIILYTGWNQFGNPYLYGIPWGRVKVLGAAQDGPVTVEEAAARNWIRRTIYWWDVEAGEYKYSSDPMTLLAPWYGYWIKALEPCQLIIPPVEQVGGYVSGELTRSAAPAATVDSPKDGWRLKLMAKAGNAEDSCSVLGVDSRALDSYDTSDVERPPSHEEYVAISFTHNDWGVNSGSYLADIRRSGSGPKEWEFNVATDQAKTDVVLTWPTMAEVPKDYTLKLVDIDGGVTRYMRTTSSYRYNSGDGGIRRFKLVAEPRGSGNRLLVTGLMVDTTRTLGGAAISYNLSVDAATDVRIKNMSGRVVRSLAEGRGTTRGINSLAWNYRDDAGGPVPAGSYLLEVVATTPEGEVAKTIRPFLVAR